MTRLFESFKQYHNANHHDGDNTFNDEIYKKSNGDDFDNPFVQECFDHFEAAWQEQQKRIDELESRVTDLRKNLKDRELAVFVRQKRIESLESMLRGHKIAIDIFSQNERCKHFSTTMFHDGKAECFHCNAIVNEKREVVGRQSKGLFNKESEP